MRGVGPRLTARQVNLALEVLIAGAIVTGLAAWSVSDRWGGPLTFVHGVSGLAIALLAPSKMRGSVRTGFRRPRASKWVSAAFGVLLVATLVLGVLHATGLWFGVGTWTALWTHLLFGFALIPFVIWHVLSRPVRPKRRDLERRAVLRLGAVGVAAAGLHVVSGADRRATGSHEVASYDPARMPRVSWLNDRRPADTDPATWDLRIGGNPVAVEQLRASSRPVVATFDCTGGWWSEQSWDAVPLSELVAEPAGRSVRVESSTGYARHFPIGDLDRLFLAVGYGGEPLRSGHGALARLVVPGRRGPEWVKWVTRIDVSDRPAWLQPPLPLT